MGFVSVVRGLYAPKQEDPAELNEAVRENNNAMREHEAATKSALVILRKIKDPISDFIDGISHR